FRLERRESRAQAGERRLVLFQAVAPQVFLGPQRGLELVHAIGLASQTRAQRVALAAELTQLELRRAEPLLELRGRAQAGSWHCRAKPRARRRSLWRRWRRRARSWRRARRSARVRRFGDERLWQRRRRGVGIRD